VIIDLRRPFASCEVSDTTEEGNLPSMRRSRPIGGMYLGSVSKYSLYDRSKKG
jgi:hypothetical protein